MAVLCVFEAFPILPLLLFLLLCVGCAHEQQVAGKQAISVRQEAPKNESGVDQVGDLPPSVSSDLDNSKTVIFLICRDPHPITIWNYCF